MNVRDEPGTALTVRTRFALIGNDDLGDLTHSGFTYTLTAGTAYIFVTTGFGNADFGTYTNTITGPAVLAVPEPQTYALMALGLVAMGLRRRAVMANAER